MNAVRPKIAPDVCRRSAIDRLQKRGDAVGARAADSDRRSRGQAYTSQVGSTRYPTLSQRELKCCRTTSLCLPIYQVDRFPPASGCAADQVLPDRTHSRLGRSFVIACRSLISMALERNWTCLRSPGHRAPGGKIERQGQSDQSIHGLWESWRRAAACVSLTLATVPSRPSSFHRSPAQSCLGVRIRNHVAGSRLERAYQGNANRTTGLPNSYVLGAGREATISARGPSYADQTPVSPSSRFRHSDHLLALCIGWVQNVRHYISALAASLGGGTVERKLPSTAGKVRPSRC